MLRALIFPKHYPRHALSHLIVTTTLEADYDHPHFTADETEI